jgi:hypothetical protein
MFLEETQKNLPKRAGESDVDRLPQALLMD